MEDTCGSMPEILSPSSPRGDIQNFIHKIKSADLKQLLHFSERVSGGQKHSSVNSHTT